MNASNEFLYWFDVENTTDRSVNYFSQLAKETLKESLPDDQRKALEVAAQRFPEAYSLLKEMLAPIGVEEPMRLRTIHQMLFAVIVSSGAIGASLSQTNKVKMMHLAPQIEGGSRGGKNSARKRAKKEDAWKKIARPMIEALIAKDPDMSQDKIAQDVCFNWKHRTPKEPGHSSLKAFISEIKGSSKISNNVLKLHKKS
ncbi:MAG: hypothetical protein ACLP4V_34185 [Methylocella sp.]